MNMVVFSICIIGILVLAPVLMFINVFCAVSDYRLQKIEKGGKTAIGINPYGESVSLSHIAAFGLSGLLLLIGLQIGDKLQSVNTAYLFFVCYAAIMPTFEILTRTAARCKEPDIQFKKYLWMKR